MDTIRHWGEWYVAHTMAQWIFFSYTILLLIEFVVGRKARASFKDIAFNYLFLGTLLGVLILVRGAGADLAQVIAKPFGGPYIDLTFGGADSVWKNIVANLSVMLVYDFFYYWHHRWQHVNAFAWVTHKLHHSDENLGITTSYKHHWTDDALRTLTIIVPMSIIFKFETTTLFWVGYLISLQGLIIHMNIHVGFGWFDRILLSPNLHRLHHSKLPEHHDRNFAAFFTFWDVLFGTFHPASRIAPPTGLDTGEKYATQWRAHTYPFKEWLQLWRERRVGQHIKSKA